MELYEDEKIEIPKTKIYLESSFKISEYIQKMNLPQNNEFVKILVEYTQTVREEAFKSGIEWVLGQMGLTKNEAIEA